MRYPLSGGTVHPTNHNKQNKNYLKRILIIVLICLIYFIILNYRIFEIKLLTEFYIKLNTILTSNILHVISSNMLTQKLEHKSNTGVVVYPALYSTHSVQCL